MKRLFIIILTLQVITNVSYAQDTLAGNYPKLNIPSGRHIIKEVVTVTGKLTVEAGAKIEFIESGVLVCESVVEMVGKNHNI